METLLSDDRDDDENIARDRGENDAAEDNRGDNAMLN